MAPRLLYTFFSLSLSLSLSLCALAGAWINNCVGHYNYGHFYRFLFYVAVTVAYAFVVLLVRVTNIEFRPEGRTRVRGASYLHRERERGAN
jgi:hypothetical protein